MFIFLFRGVPVSFIWLLSTLVDSLYRSRKNGPAVKKKRIRFLEFVALLFFRMLERTDRL